MTMSKCVVIGLRCVKHRFVALCARKSGSDIVTVELEVDRKWIVWEYMKTILKKVTTKTSGKDIFYPTNNKTDQGWLPFEPVILQDIRCSKERKVLVRSTKVPCESNRIRSPGWEYILPNGFVMAVEEQEVLTSRNESFVESARKKAGLPIVQAKAGTTIERVRKPVGAATTRPPLTSAMEQQVTKAVSENPHLQEAPLMIYQTIGKDIGVFASVATVMEVVGLTDVAKRVMDAANGFVEKSDQDPVTVLCTVLKDNGGTNDSACNHLQPTRLGSNNFHLLG